MSEKSPFVPVFELTRGEIGESLHFGAVTVTDKTGTLIAGCGDPGLVTYLRSSAKPFQVLPLIEAGGVDHFGLTLKEVALMCASHSGTDAHVQVAASIQKKVDVGELDLMCGIQPPMDEATREQLRARGQTPTQNRHNCSGKHSGMLAQARLNGWSVDHYIDPIHPVQQQILKTFAEVCAVPMEDVELGIDGCSAPNFAIPLRQAAQGFARLCDPDDFPPARASACRTIIQAMTTHPDMIAGPGRFDTRLMQVTDGRIVAKGGAEGYQIIGIRPGALGAHSPALGITVKISDGDARHRARSGVVLEVLRQLGALNATELAELAEFGPHSEIYNWRKLTVGEARPVFKLEIFERLETLPV